VTPSEQVTGALARNCARYRRAAGLSQAQLARKAGICQTTVAFLETGARPASLRVFTAVAAALGVPPARLLSGPDCEQCSDWPRAGSMCLACGRAA
jgi:transcriptional regulator with XRE-family HTH domain